MFSSALKSLTSNISSNYTVAPNPTSTCGPWKIYDGKKRSGGKAVSIFVFERKSLEVPGGLGGRGAAASVRQAHDEVVERLKKEASSLARLRHPSILELVEPVEETRTGGLTFATEPVTASLGGLLEEKDEQEKAGGIAGRTSRYVVEDPEGGGRRRRDLEIDELEIQKGLLQIGKGLEFLHESAGLVHANLTPDAILINAKSDWKISGLGFSTPYEGSNTASSITPISLSEALNYDSRLPRFVQLNIDYSSPDFVMDNSVTPAADMFSLGLIVIALYNSPHRTPLDTSYSTSTYKRLLSSPSSTPTQRNNYLSKQPIPKDVVSSLLPRLITRRPDQRFSAREFQQAQYFDSILVSTLRFLESLPAKTPSEKTQFMRGLPRMMHQFPKSVLEKKILPALLEEMKDFELIAPILDNAFKIVELVPNPKRTFSERVAPKLRETFIPANRSGKSQDKDTSRDAGLLVLLENMSLIAKNCSGKEFKDDIMPLLYLGFESPTNSIQDAALQTLPVLLPVLDFSTLKNELFPVVAQVFSKTSSMAIKIRGLEALTILCGGMPNRNAGDEYNLMSLKPPEKSSVNNAVLDKYTVQEKVVPLLKGIKTKEPAVMMAALDVFQQVGKVADTTFLAFEVLPSLWQFALGPLLNLSQFEEFMTLIKTLSSRVEQEQTRKLKELGSTGRGAVTSQQQDKTSNGAADTGDFESLVTGRKATSNANGLADSWDSGWDNDALSKPVANQNRLQQTATFSWSTPSQPNASSSSGARPMQPNLSRTVTPDLNMNSYAPLQPTNQKPTLPNALQQPMLARSSSTGATPLASPPQPMSTNIGGSAANWSTLGNMGNPNASPWTMSNTSSVLQPQNLSGNQWSGMSSSSSSLSQNPWSGTGSSMSNSFSNMTISPPPPPTSSSAQNAGMSGNFGQDQSQNQKTGLDKYDSLL